MGRARPPKKGPLRPGGVGHAEFQRGLALHRLGHMPDAERIYQSVLRIEPRHFGAVYLLGKIFFERGWLPQALDQFALAVAIDPREFSARLDHANASAMLGRLEAALASYDKAIALKRDVPEVFYNRGNALRDLGRGAEAFVSFGRAIALKPDFAAAFANRGTVAMSLGRLADALADYGQALALKPDWQAFYNQGNALRALGRFDEALASYDAAIAQKPDSVDAFNNRGATLVALKRLDEALASYDRVLALQPGSARGFYNRAIVLRDMKRLADSVASHDRAIVLKPDYAEAFRDRGLCKLLAGALPAGWLDNEQRWQAADFPASRPNLPARHWQGEDLAGKSILVYAEQGLGDMIQFCRYLTLLAARGGLVSFLGPKRILPVLGALSEKVRLVDAIPGDARFDFQCALMSVPLWFGTDLTTIPAAVPYLTAPDSRRIAAWGARLGSKGFKIGIAWQGNPEGSVDIGRSIPLRAFEPVARIAGVRLISLQKNFELDQLAALPAGMHVETLGDDFDAGPAAFADTAAVMGHLDLVITLDTSIAHLAGAFGRPTWVALKHVPDWRWMLDRADSPWYPTMRLFRQTKDGDWTGVFEAIASALRARIDSLG